MTSLKVGDVVELRAGTGTVAGQTWTWWCEGACRSASAPSRSCRNSLSLVVDALKAVESPANLVFVRHLVPARPRWNHHPSLVIQSPQSADSL
jgi:hypothetical protein